MRKIVVIGGGTGTYTVLSGLKKYPNVELTAIVSMADSGGSNRVLRDEFGLLPTSDLRQCLAALSGTNGDNLLWRKLFSYRYSKGVGISGMTFGNLFMAALADIYGSQIKAIEKTAEILRVKGQVLPVSFDDVNLIATYSNGDQVVGEHFIDEPKDRHDGKLRIKKLNTIPKAKANPKAIEAIKTADMIILGPGDLYTSILANIVVDGISEAIRSSKAKVIYVVNLMTKYGQTYEMSAGEHAKEMEKYLKCQMSNVKSKSQMSKLKNNIDYVIINSGRIPEEILNKYKKEQAREVKDDLNKDCGYNIIRGDFIPKHAASRPAGDVLKRSLIRHDGQKLAKAIISIK